MPIHLIMCVIVYRKVRDSKATQLRALTETIAIELHAGLAIQMAKGLRLIGLVYWRHHCPLSGGLIPVFFFIINLIAKAKI
ncbi:hypothetical protein [Pseudoalteromonas viridis]|uniref:Uncharacterized protein n=1 Tax=Pseudoalteromonas viridis TaxID=339617 RepID=A0ABX7VBC8_9GAMM|nr:hypothetical protein [Pseudoalteromonas viridis]QTL37770.1 hypothetical protein J5X90_18675 [Pseudoalteromonas viridis]